MPDGTCTQTGRLCSSRILATDALNRHENLNMIYQKTKPTTFVMHEVHEIAERDPRTTNQIISDYQYKTLWTYAANCILALWLVTSPFMCNYRSAPLAVSDIVSGATVLYAELLSFSPNRYNLRWITPVVALWLLFAPLVFWSPTPAVYFMDTLVACSLITFSFLVPGTPGQGGFAKPGPDQPPGWSYNPSSWIRRWLGIALALFGFFVSRYLAARQLGYIDMVYDPFFGNSSTDHVLHSAISKSFPISDAGFGSVAYALEVLAGFMGDRARWRTSPWVVTSFALLVVPLGITSIILVILQPVAVGHWCGLCLIAAVALLMSVPLAVHEIIAMGQVLVDAKRKGKDVWNIFWMGAAIEGAGEPDPDRRNFNLMQRWIASVQGVTVPLALIAQLAIGTWLMARPDVVHAGVSAANADHLLGAVIVTVAAVATAEVTRTARFINILAGLVLCACGLLFAREVPVVMCSDLISGIAVALLSLPKGEILERYAGWNKFVK